MGPRCLSLGLAGLAALLAAATPAVGGPHTYTVVIDKLKFGTLPPVLHKGDEIVWVNRDFLRHTATASDHSFDVDLLPGKSGRIVLDKTGTIPFVCRFHPGMHGTLSVR